MVAKNSAFKGLHAYYTQRPDNPLKKMQSLIALCNKLIRIFYAIGKKQFEFSEERMLKDIPHMRAKIEMYKGGITLVQKLFYVLIALTLFMISGCSNEGETTTVTTINSIDAEEVLTLDSDADIFQYDGVIYKTNIDWVEEMSLTKDVQIGEIKNKNDANTDLQRFFPLTLDL